MSNSNDAGSSENLRAVAVVAIVVAVAMYAVEVSNSKSPCATCVVTTTQETLAVLKIKTYQTV